MRIVWPFILFALVLLVLVQSAAARSDSPADGSERSNVFTLWPLVHHSVPVALRAGQHLNVAYTVVKGDRHINFRIIGPSGEVLQGRPVSDGESCGFDADDDGTYLLDFDNEVSLWSSKTVYLEYSASPL